MARESLGYDKVVKAIDKLILNEDKPTISNIRKIIGRGSSTTISKFLKKWKDVEHEEKGKELEIKFEKNNPEKHMESSKKVLNELKDIDNSKNGDDKIMEKLISMSKRLSSEILSDISNEWDFILKEKSNEIKIKKLYSALVKEQIRRETSEKITRETKIYTNIVKEQTSQRIKDLKKCLEEKIAFFDSQFKDLKYEFEKDLKYYRDQLIKANNAIISLKKHSKEE